MRESYKLKTPAADPEEILGLEPGGPPPLLRRMMRSSCACEPGARISSNGHIHTTTAIRDPLLPARPSTAWQRACATYVTLRKTIRKRAFIAWLGGCSAHPF